MEAAAQTNKSDGPNKSDTVNMHTTQEEGTTPSFQPDDLLTAAQVSEITGHIRATLHQYSSYHRSGKFLGPKPTRLPGAQSLLYRYVDVVRYVEDKWTGEGAE